MTWKNWPWDNNPVEKQPWSWDKPKQIPVGEDTQVKDKVQKAVSGRSLDGFMF